MTAATKQTLWYWIQRLGLPSVLLVLVWLAYDRQATALRESHQEFLRDTIAVTRQQASTLDKLTDVERQQMHVLEGVRATQDQQCQMLRTLCEREPREPPSERDRPLAVSPAPLGPDLPAL